jgi:hypothetical protein
MRSWRSSFESGGTDSARSETELRRAALLIALEQDPSLQADDSATLSRLDAAVKVIVNEIRLRDERDRAIAAKAVHDQAEASRLALKMKMIVSAQLAEAEAESRKAGQAARQVTKEANRAKQLAELAKMTPGRRLYAANRGMIWIALVGALVVGAASFQTAERASQQRAVDAVRAAKRAELSDRYAAWAATATANRRYLPKVILWVRAPSFTVGTSDVVSVVVDGEAALVSGEPSESGADLVWMVADVPTTGSTYEIQVGDALKQSFSPYDLRATNWTATLGG